MKLVDFDNGDIVFNWYQLPPELALNFVLRDKIFEELQSQFSDLRYLDTKMLFDMNMFVIERIRAEKKKNEIHNKASAKNS